jgi:DNA helicase-2/ATP-dependent DNA helicase PcrA
MGDRHVYGAKSRFLTPAVMRCLEPVSYGEKEGSARAAGAASPVDVAAQLRGMWSG